MVGYPTRNVRRRTFLRCALPHAGSGRTNSSGRLREAGGGVFEQIEYGPFDPRLDRGTRERSGLEVADGSLDRVPGPELVEDPRIDIGGATDGGRVAEVLRDLPHRGAHVALPGSLRRRAGPNGVALRDEDGREHRRVPGTEVLRREGPAGDLADVVVDVARTNVVPSVARAVREELRTSGAATLESSHHLRDGGIDDRLDAVLAALRDEVEHPLVAVQPRVLLLHGGEPVGAVLFGVRLGADTEEAPIEEPRRTGEDPLCRK